MTPETPELSALRYYVTLDGKVSGPHGLEALRQMASVHAFTRDTLATPEHAENWQPIHAQPELADALFPTTTKLQLKAKAITHTVDSVTPVSVEEILRTNLASEARSTPQSDYTARSGRRPGLARTRDYLIATIFGNALGGAAWYFLPHDQLILVFIVSYLTMLNVGLYWIFYHVMNRY
ncbi:MAG: DUF4339 domain-containing protein [Nibricoccus sp.]